jgi:hemerythrin-like domain-containing protein
MNLPLTYKLLLGSIIMSTLSANALGRPTDKFRAEHAEIKIHLSHVEQWAGDLTSQPPPGQKKTMAKIVRFFKEHIRPHAEWEERRLYPAVDKRVGKGTEVFTSTMRYEHRIVGRWVEDLVKEEKKTAPDAKDFARKTDQLLGLIRAHFEEEEEVLLPILDKSMTPAQFEKEISSGEGH